MCYLWDIQISPLSHSDACYESCRCLLYSIRNNLFEWKMTFGQLVEGISVVCFEKQNRESMTQPVSTIVLMIIKMANN